VPSASCNVAVVESEIEPGAAVKILPVEDEQQLAYPLNEKPAGAGFVVDHLPDAGLALEAAALSH
jgi:hypothetical protein